MVRIKYPSRVEAVSVQVKIYTTPPILDKDKFIQGGWAPAHPFSWENLPNTRKVTFPAPVFEKEDREMQSDGIHWPLYKLTDSGYRKLEAHLKPLAERMLEEFRDVFWNTCFAHWRITGVGLTIRGESISDFGPIYHGYEFDVRIKQRVDDEDEQEEE